MADDVTFYDLISLPTPLLESVMMQGTAPTAEELAGFEFRGFNPPWFAKALGFQKFMKGFFVDPEGKLAGYNLFVRRPRGGADAPWEPSASGTSGRHGFYDVTAVRAGDRYDAFPNAVLLDYGSGRNAWLNPESRIRDYLVRVDPGNPDLFLGKAYLDLGVFSVFSNFFVLERMRSAPT